MRPERAGVLFTNKNFFQMFAKIQFKGIMEERCLKIYLSEWNNRKCIFIYIVQIVFLYNIPLIQQKKAYKENNRINITFLFKYICENKLISLPLQAL